MFVHVMLDKLHRSVLQGVCKVATTPSNQAVDTLYVFLDRDQRHDTDDECQPCHQCNKPSEQSPTDAYCQFAVAVAVTHVRRSITDMCMSVYRQSVHCEANPAEVRVTAHNLLARHNANVMT